MVTPLVFVNKDLYWFQYGFTIRPISTFNLVQPCFIAGMACLGYLPAALLDNHDDMTVTRQTHLSRPVTDWQPIPAVIMSRLTPLHSSICHSSSSALRPLSPSPLFNYTSIRLTHATAESNPGQLCPCLAVSCSGDLKQSHGLQL